MGRKCDNCGQSAERLLKVSGPKEHWCFACIYEKGLVDYNERNLK